jgi:hypothetical protein
MQFFSAFWINSSHSWSAMLCKQLRLIPISMVTYGMDRIQKFRNARQLQEYKKLGYLDVTVHEKLCRGCAGRSWKLMGVAISR